MEPGDAFTAAIFPQGDFFDRLDEWAVSCPGQIGGKGSRGESGGGLEEVASVHGGG